MTSELEQIRDEYEALQKAKRKSEELSERISKKLEAHLEKYIEYKTQKEELDAQVKLLKDKMEDEQSHLLALLTTIEGQNYRSKVFGTAYIKREKQFAMPKILEDKQKLFDYLKERGMLEDMQTINSRKFNSWCKKEVEAKEQMGDVGFVPPGVEEPFEKETLIVNVKREK